MCCRHPDVRRILTQIAPSRWPICSLSLTYLLLILLTFTRSADARARIAVAELTAERGPGILVDNSAFTPPVDALQAQHPFVGTLQLHEIEMQTVPTALKSRRVLGKDAKIFPAGSITFITVNGDLVPTTQDVIVCGSLAGGRSFWDLIVQPGQVWSETGDGPWSRGAFPFALVNSLSGETHNGVAMFLYREGRVSNLRFQIVQQTSPYYVAHYFTAAGLVPATGDMARPKNEAAVTKRYLASVADRVSISTWDEFARKVGAEQLREFDEPPSSTDVVLAGMDYAGTFYLKFCSSAAGPLPWCDRARFGIWSATKALANEVALLRLAQKFGSEVFELKIRDYIPSVVGFAGWQEVRFDDAINMSTGVGNGSSKSRRDDVFDGVAASYSTWYNARSAEEKINALLATGGIYRWGPGKVVRYRDQDMFILGVAMDRFLKSREGPTADIWSMLEQEVFAPIGIHYAPTSRTIETGGRRGQPLMAFGYYPTIGDIVKIARLYEHNGNWNGRQLLYSQRISQILYGPSPRGLPTGLTGPFGMTYYFNAFWQPGYDSLEGCHLFYPRMEGFGGNVVALLPGPMTGIRIGKLWTDNDKSVKAANNTSGMARTADRISVFCK